MPINLQPAHWPIDDSLAGAVTVALREAGEPTLPFIGAGCRAVWAEERNLSDEIALAAILEAMGLDAGRWLDAARDARMAAQREADTRRGIDAGIFGTPTYIVGDEVFWGQDRLDFVERELAG